MSNPSPAYERFLSSMIMDHEKWHDGIGYDLAIQAHRNDGFTYIDR